MTKRRKRIQISLGGAAAVLGIGAAMYGALELHLWAIVLSVVIAAIAIALLVMQHSDTRPRVIRIAGTDDSVWVSQGGYMILSEPRADHPKPKRTGEKKEIGICRAHKQDDYRWEVRVKGRRGVRGWIQESSDEPESRLWHVKHVTQGWVGRFPSEEAAYAHLASMP